MTASHSFLTKRDPITLSAGRCNYPCISPDGSLLVGEFSSRADAPRYAYDLQVLSTVETKALCNPVALQNVCVYLNFADDKHIIRDTSSTISLYTFDVNTGRLAQTGSINYYSNPTTLEGGHVQANNVFVTQNNCSTLRCFSIKEDKFNLDETIAHPPGYVFDSMFTAARLEDGRVVVSAETTRDPNKGEMPGAFTELFVTGKDGKLEFTGIRLNEINLFTQLGDQLIVHNRDRLLMVDTTNWKVSLPNTSLLSANNEPMQINSIIPLDKETNTFLIQEAYPVIHVCQLKEGKLAQIETMRLDEFDPRRAVFCTHNPANNQLIFAQSRGSESRDMSIVRVDCAVPRLESKKSSSDDKKPSSDDKKSETASFFSSSTSTLQSSISSSSSSTSQTPLNPGERRKSLGK